jgi:hypothetical protein
MLINIFFIFLGLLLTIAFESFSITLFSFSIAIIAIFVLIDKWDWRKWLVVVFIITVLLDVVLHRPVGITMLITTVTSLVLNLLFLVMPKKEIILSYIQYFFAIFTFYLLLDLFVPFLQDSVWGVLTWTELLSHVIKSVISVLLIFLINTTADNFRSNSDLSI